MPIAYSDTEIYDTQMDEAVAKLPESIQRVYIDTRDAVEAPEKPAGEFKPNKGTGVPLTSIDAPKTPYGVMGDLEIPEGTQQGFSVGKFLKEVAHSLVTLPERAIQNSKFSVETGTYDPAVPMEAAMTAITGGIPFAQKGALGSSGGNVNSNYVDMFIKSDKIPPKTSPTPADSALSDFYKGYDEYKSKLPQAKVESELDPTEKALKAIMEALDGPGAYDAKYGAEALKKAKTESGVPFSKSALDPETDALKYVDLMNKGSMKEADTVVFNKNYSKKAEPKSNTVIYGYNIDLNVLSPKQLKDLETLKKDYKNKLITKKEYMDELEVQAKLFNKMLHERAQYHYERAKETLPEHAKNAGYDTVAFRGMRNYDEIKSIHNYDKTGVMYSSDSSLLADMYSNYLSKHPGWNVKAGDFSEGATVAPMLINTKNYHVYDAKGNAWQFANAKAMKEAKEAGKEGVIIKNVWDEPNSTKALGKPATVYITFPEGASTIKSRFAKKFSAESKDMLHLIPVIAVGGAAGYVSKEPDPEEKG